MANRKLLAEVDRLLKKVAEGVEVFETTFEKIQTSTSPAQKEKYEAELKKEIKKLQRFRDQIKSWISSSEIKDKRALMDNRKLIENLMERFKALEREVKTKAFSKDGLNREPKIDPAEKEKADIAQWIASCVDRLQEAEMELLQLAMKKSRKHDQEKYKELENKIGRHKHHQARLELVLRTLENGKLKVDQVKSIKDDVEFYIDENQNGDDFEEDQGIYDELNLDEAEAYFNSNELYNDMNDSSSESEKEVKETAPPPKKTASKPQPAAPEASTPTRNLQKNASNSTTSSSVAAAAVNVSPAPSNTASRKASTEVAASPKPAVRYAAAVAGAVSASTSAGLTAAAVVAGGASTDTKIEEKKPFAKVVEANLPAGPTMAKIVQGVTVTATPSMSSSSSVQSLPAAHTNMVDPPIFDESFDFPAINAERKTSAAIADLVASYQSAKENSKSLSADSAYVLRMLDTSASFVPDHLDCEKYEPAHPYPTPSYYPSNTQITAFEKFDLDTLFFIFYYRPGTYEQYVAAKLLKQKSWRYHKQYFSWFQRHEEPEVITEEYEKGVYVYWDYDDRWCARKKEGFMFEYSELEDEF